MSENKKAKQSAYEQQESRLSAQSVAFIKLLTQRGILGDTEIDDDKIRQAQKEKKRHTYHNTEMLLQHYRDIVWALECFPSTIVEELDRPLDDLDALISYVDVEMSLDNRKLESRIESIKKSRLLLDRVNDALTILKKKPDNGEKMYELIYLTYIAPEKLSHSDSYMFITLAAVAIGGISMNGGKGHVVGSASGALIITIVLSVLTVLKASLGVQQLLYGVVLLGALVLEANKLNFGKRKGEKT